MTKKEKLEQKAVEWFKANYQGFENITARKHKDYYCIYTNGNYLMQVFKSEIEGVVEYEH